MQYKYLYKHIYLYYSFNTFNRTFLLCLLQLSLISFHLHYSHSLPTFRVIAIKTKLVVVFTNTIIIFKPAIEFKSNTLIIIILVILSIGSFTARNSFILNDSCSNYNLKMSII